jgi:2-hydroxy-3-oxopropionate reductase
VETAVIGVGVMGSAIAGRLLDTGARVWIHDVDMTRCSSLAQRGARVAQTAREATAAATYIITSLNSAAIVDKAVFGPEGVAAAAGTEKLLVDMSSIDARSTAEMSARLLASGGMGWVDAPLSGGAPAAATGTLTLMLGGTESDIERATPLLSRLSNHFTHMGTSGAGQTVKLINQILCASAFLGVAEAVRFAQGHGVDATRIPAALAGGRADSRILQEFMAKMARRDFSPTGRIDNMLKDLEAVQSAAADKRIAMPVVSLITELHRILVAGGLGPADSAAYICLHDLGARRPL